MAAEHALEGIRDVKLLHPTRVECVEATLANIHDLDPVDSRSFFSKHFSLVDIGPFGRGGESFFHELSREVDRQRPVL